VIPANVAEFWEAYAETVGGADETRLYGAFHFGDSEALAAEFAVSEGEGDRSLEYWREAQRRYFTRECQSAGREFTEDMPVVCERFRVVYRRAA
jgi:hypothetical protein